MKYFVKLLKWLNLYNQRFPKKIFNSRLMMVNPEDHIQRQLFWYGKYEDEAMRYLEKIITPKSVVFDVGANVGYFSLVSSKLAYEGIVHAFEPVAIIREQLLENIAINRVNNVFVHPYAVSNKSVKGAMEIASRQNIGMSRLIAPADGHSTEEKVEVIALDEWVKTNEITIVDLVKIDAEGSEFNILDGMRNLLLEMRPVLLLEIVTGQLALYGANAVMIYELLHNYKYKAFIPMRGNNLREADFGEEGYTVFFFPAPIRNWELGIGN